MLHFKRGYCDAHAIVRGGARCASQVLHRCAQAVSRGAARCATQELNRGAHADARGATHILGRSARDDACGRSFAALSTQVPTVGLRLWLVVPRPMPAAIASRCLRIRPKRGWDVKYHNLTGGFGQSTFNQGLFCPR